MLFKACLILLSIGVSVCEDTENCHIRASRICGHEELPTDYPETAEELKRDCIIVHEIGRCYIKFYEDCPGYEDHSHSIQRFVDFIDQECHEDSPIFQEISRNIECVTPAARSLSEVCSWDNFSEEETDQLISLLEPLWEKDSYLCGFGLERLTCAAYVISNRCGSQLKDTITTILENTDENYEECTDDVLEALLPFKEYYVELLTRQEMS